MVSQRDHSWQRVREEQKRGSLSLAFVVVSKEVLGRYVLAAWNSVAVSPYLPEPLLSQLLQAASVWEVQAGGLRLW